MLSRSFHNAINEIRVNGITTEEAIRKYSEFMTEREEQIIMSMGKNTRATRRTVGKGNNTRVSNVISVTIAKGMKVRPMRRTAKTSDCKGFRLVKGSEAWAFRVMSNTEVEITSPSGKTMRPSREDARKIWSRLTSKGFERETEKNTEKEFRLTKGEGSFERAYSFLVIGNVVTVTDRDDHSQMQMTKEDARKFYKMLTREGYKAA